MRSPVALLVGLVWLAVAPVSIAQDAPPPGRPAEQQPAAAPAPAIAWPERVPPGGLSGGKGLVRPVEAPVGLWSNIVSASLRGAELTEAQADARALVGGRAVMLEGGGSFVFMAAEAAPPGGPPRAKPSARGAAEAFKFVSAERLPQPKDGDAGADLIRDACRLQRTWFAFYQPKEGNLRGVALVMPGLFNTPEPVIDHVVAQLGGRGWGVLRMMAQPSRFTEVASFDLDPDHLDASAARVAGSMEDRVAECAYSAQAAFDHLLAQHPGLAALPRIAVGMSGGAMTLPSVVAREPEKYAGAVLIAGGADLYAITSESNYRAMIGTLTYTWTRPPTDAEKDQFDRLYLEHAPLDSYHTAAALRGKPVLMIHGTHDGAVPARLGDLLWERLGRPERWSEEAGHEEVFMRLPQKSGRLLDWLDQHFPAKPPG
jgi:hypothetical protein